MDGILLVDKPEGITSAGVVRAVKKHLRASKVGHLGTLDPFATGVLPLCLGEGSKIAPFLSQESKAYSAALRLGVATDTLDSTGEELERAPVPDLSDRDLAAIARRFVGEIEQRPPMYSAVKRGGVPLYRLARRGIDVERKPRTVRIESLELALASPGLVAFEVRCSKGTYVRVLGAEIAAALGSTGHLESLRRTEFGPFGISEALPLDAVLSRRAPPVLSPREALRDLRELEAAASVVHRIRLGQQRALEELPAPKEAETAKVIGPDGALVAVVKAGSGAWSLLRVFAAD